MLRYQTRYSTPAFSQPFMSVTYRIRWNNYIGSILLLNMADGNAYLGELSSYNASQGNIVLSQLEGGQITLKVADITEGYKITFEKLM